MITPANALKFSIWLAANHPRAFAAVLSQTRMPGARASPAGLSGTYLPAARRARLRTAARGRFGRFGDVWDDIDSGSYDASALRMGADSGSPESLSEFTPTATYESDPTLASINVDMPAASSFDLSGAATSIDNAGGFWSSLGSGLSSIGGGLATAIGTVAGAVLNPNTLSAAGNLAATVIKANGATAQQQAILEAQIANTANGTGAHPVTYVTNPATGQRQALVYNPNTGQYQAASAVSSAFSSGGASTLGAYVPYILVGGALLVTALVMRR